MERGNQRFRCDGFPSPYLFTRNSWSFAPAPKNAVHFLYGAVFHRPGGTPGPPYAVPSLFEIGILITEFSVSWIRGLWLGAFGK